MQAVYADALADAFTDKTSYILHARPPRRTYVAATFASWMAFHTFCGVKGVLSCLIPSSASASITPLAMQGGPPIAPRLAAALRAERIGAAGRGIVQRHRNRRNVVGARQAVILIARGEKLPFGIV